ncbi:MAG: hypothetical protein HY906_04490, partial [Deltaproteobacteria bacterium]|nr:hypothetical protein [Deltaproteobacteria bacterium]
MPSTNPSAARLLVLAMSLLPTACATEREESPRATQREQATLPAGIGAECTQVTDGGLKQYPASCRQAYGNDPANFAGIPFNRCDAPECFHDVALCRASAFLDYAHSFEDPPAFTLRKLALEQAQRHLEEALFGFNPGGGDPGSMPWGSLVHLLRNHQAAWCGAFGTCDCTLSPGTTDRFYPKLAHAISSLADTVKELMEMDLAEADQAPGLYPGYANARTREWQGFPPNEADQSALANGSRQGALNRLIGVPQAVWDEHHTGKVATNLDLLDPCTVDATKPEIQRALSLRKRYEFGSDGTDAGTPFPASLLPPVANEVRVLEGHLDGGVDAYSSPTQLLEEYKISEAEFNQAGTYLNEEARVFFRDTPPVASSVLPRSSIRTPLISYGLVQQRRLKSYAVARFGQLNFGALHEGLLYELASIRGLLSDGTVPSHVLLTPILADIASLIGRRYVTWKAGTNLVYGFDQYGALICRGLRVVVGGVTQEEAQRLVLFDGQEDWACAVTGAIRGQACGQDHPQPLATDGSSVVDGYRLGTMKYTICASAEPPYVPQSPFIAIKEGTGRFTILEGADFSYINIKDKWDQNASVEYTAPVGGSLEELGLRITERNTRNCGESRYNALGLRRDLVPPLENELFDTGNAYEDSFRFYLDQAKSAATEAYQAASAAATVEREMKNSLRKLADEYKNLTANANDQLAEICGADSVPVATLDAPACSARRAAIQFSSMGLLPVPDVPCSEPGDVPFLAGGDVDSFRDEMHAFIYNAENCIEEKLGKSVLVLPDVLTDAEFDASERARYGGEYLVTMLDAAKQLVVVKDMTIGMKGSMGAYTQHMEEMAQRLDQLNDYDQQRAISMMRATGNFIKSMTNACDSLASLGGNNAGSSLIYAADMWQAQLDYEHGEAAMNEALAKFRGDAIGFVSGIRQQAEKLTYAFTELEQIDARLVNLEQKQLRIMAAATRQADSANYLAVSNNPIARSTYTKAGVRAREALARSKVLSFIARRAVEFKLVKDLKKETGTAPYVQAPREWVESVFGATQAGDPESDDPAADSTVLYVQRLSDYVLGYPFIYPFQDGEDWAVISLKDDYLRPPVDCVDTSVATGRNLLPWSEAFEHWTPRHATVQGGETDPRGRLHGSCLQPTAAGELAAVSWDSVSIPPTAEGEPITNVTFSVWVKPTANSPVALVYYPTNCGEDPACGSYFQVQETMFGPPPAGQSMPWIRVSATFQVPAAVRGA